MSLKSRGNTRNDDKCKMQCNICDEEWNKINKNTHVETIYEQLRCQTLSEGYQFDLRGCRGATSLPPELQRGCFRITVRVKWKSCEEQNFRRWRWMCVCGHVTHVQSVKSNIVERWLLHVALIVEMHSIPPSDPNATIIVCCDFYTISVSKYIFF